MCAHWHVIQLYRQTYACACLPACVWLSSQAEADADADADCDAVARARHLHTHNKHFKHYIRV